MKGEEFIEAGARHEGDIGAIGYIGDIIIFIVVPYRRYGHGDLEFKIRSPWVGKCYLRHPNKRQE